MKDAAIFPHDLAEISAASHFFAQLAPQLLVGTPNLVLDANIASPRIG